jgi:hypothetical protein
MQDLHGLPEFRFVEIPALHGRHGAEKYLATASVQESERKGLRRSRVRDNQARNAAAPMVLFTWIYKLKRT